MRQIHRSPSKPAAVVCFESDEHLRALYACRCPRFLACLRLAHVYRCQAASEMRFLDANRPATSLLLSPVRVASLISLGLG